jgi:ppGpp synthetase/RelA/SpoT-type nucleotidyltranferase
MPLTEEATSDWVDDHNELLGRAKRRITDLVEQYFADWSRIWEFSYEQIEKARVKDASRIYAKAQRRGLAAPAQLLQRCHEKGDGRSLRFPVHDLVGVRVLVMSLNHVANIRKCLEDLQYGDAARYPFDNPQDFDVDDINSAPRSGGYRALHIDGSVNVSVAGIEYAVPFEIQVKTLAQHVFGQHTHDDAYVPDGVNADARYVLVKKLQAALAQQLEGADLLLAQIENLASDLRESIARSTAGPETNVAGALNAVYEKTGLLLTNAQASEVADHARARGLTRSADLASLIDPSGDAAAEFADAFSAAQFRPPRVEEVLDGLLGTLLAPDPKQHGTPTAELGAQLEEEPPSNELDELDPDADLDIG